MRGRQPLSTKSPSDVMAKYNGQTRLHSAKTVWKTAKHFSKQDPETLAKLTQAVANNVSTSAKVFAWDQPTSGTTVNVQLLNQVSVPPAHEQRQP